MPQVLIQQWCAVMQKMEVETTRYMSRYHYFFGYSGVSLAFALATIGIPGGSHRLPGAFPSWILASAAMVACLVATATAAAALAMVQEYIRTRWLWRDALRKIEDQLRGDPRTIPIEAIANNAGFFFAAYSHLGQWLVQHEPLPTEKFMRRIAIAWLCFTGLLCVASISYLVYCVACSPGE